MRPYFTIIGNLTLDIIDESKTVKPGGPGLYAGLAALHLGYPVRIVSSIGTDYPMEFLEKLKNLGIDLRIKMVQGRTTTFKLIYEGDRRKVILLESGPEIPYELIEDIDKKFIALVSPVYKEVSLDFIKKLKKKTILLGIDFQGFVRKARSDGVVEYTWDEVCDEVSRYADFIHIEESEAQGLNTDPLRIALYLTDRCKCPVSVTMGERGSYLAFLDEVYYIPVPRVYSGNPTGVGDIFTAIFLLRYYETDDFIDASRWATIAAGLKVLRSYDGNWFSRSEVELLSGNVTIERVLI